MIGDVERHEISVHGHEVLKTAPRGYPADHPRIGLLRCKGLVAWQEWPAGPWLGTAAARRHVARFLAASRPLGDWLERHVGLARAVAAGVRTGCSPGTARTVPPCARRR